MVLEKRKIVVVGGGIAGLTAAISARETNADAEIILLSKEIYPPYSKPSLPCIIKGTVTRPEEIAIYPPEFLEAKKIRLLRGFEASSIDSKKRIVKLRRVTSNEVKQVDYQALVLATGGHDIVPPIRGAGLKNVFTLRDFNDASKISDVAKAYRGAFVVGAGPIALSVAEALIKRGVDTRIVIRSRILRTLIEQDLSPILQKKIEQAGAKALTNAEVEEIGGSQKVEYVKVLGEKIETSMIIFATGVRPSMKLAEEAKVRLGKRGIQVDEHLRTSNPEIYAAGDCIEATDFITKKTAYFPVGSAAAEAAKIAGINAAGGDEKSDGFLRVQGDKLFGMDMTSIGHSSATAEEMCIKIKVVDVETSSIAESSYFAKKYPTKVKIITDEKERIVGAQAMDVRFATQDRYLLFQAVKERMRIGEFSTFHIRA